MIGGTDLQLISVLIKVLFQVQTLDPLRYDIYMWYFKTNSIHLNDVWVYTIPISKPNTNANTKTDTNMKMDK